MGNTPLKLYDTDGFKKVIRYIHLNCTVDRLGICLLMHVPFGTVSRIISQLESEGYLMPSFDYYGPSKKRRKARRAVYERESVNHELFMIDTPDKGKHINWYYGTAPKGRAQTLLKTLAWSSFMKRYNLFLKTGKDPGRRYRG